MKISGKMENYNIVGYKIFVLKFLYLLEPTLFYDTMRIEGSGIDQLLHKSA